MPVKYIDDFFNDMSFLSDSCPAADLVFPEIWDKFQLEDLGESFADDFDLMDSSSQPTILNLDNWCEITNHDCMWAGHCGSKEHPVDVRPIKTNFVNNFTKQTTQNAGRSLLLKTQTQPQQQTLLNTAISNVLNAIESPPNSDDEEAKTKTETLKILQEAISECEDNDLYDYFEDDDLMNDAVKEEVYVKEEYESPEEAASASTSSTPVKSPQVAQFTSDHCYHKDKNATMHINLGIETPSDSEEEIDVVTISDKQSLLAPSRMPCLLPNNPTTRDRQQIQRTMASAINSFGVKTLLPRGKPALIRPPEEDTPPKRRVSDHRGVKRPRRRSSPSSSPYKKRPAFKSCNQSSDSEQEPSEKRNMHNNMERQRRIDLRNAFEDLKTMVPEVKKRERAPKVVILREASLYCRKLESISYNMVDQIEDLRRQQKQLRARVSQLRLSLAHKHR